MPVLQHLNAVGHRQSTEPELEVALYGDGLLEKLTSGAACEHAFCLGVPERAAILAAGGDGIEHLLLRLHMYTACKTSGVRASSHCLMIGINNILAAFGKKAIAHVATTRH